VQGPIIKFLVGEWAPDNDLTYSLTWP